MLERGALRPKRRAEGRWTFAVEAEHGLGKAVRVPSTVGVVVRARLSRLSPEGFALLAAAAVLEHGLTFERLSAVASLSNDAALPALDELVSSRLLIEGEGPYSAGDYTFPNDMVRDVVDTQAGEARRRLFHARALEHLAAAGEPAAVLAHHALSAGLAEAAFYHSAAAGEAALALPAATEAVVHFERARALARDAALFRPGAQAHLRAVYRQLGRAYELSGRPGQAAAVYQELEQLDQH